MAHGPLPLKKLLRSGPVLHRLEQTLTRQQQLLLRVRRALPDPLAPHCRAVVQEGGKLTIFADSPVWASRLRYAVRELAGKLPCADLGIHSIRVGIHFTHAPRKPLPRPARRLSAANRRLLHQLADDIPDPALKASLQRLSRRG